MNRTLNDLGSAYQNCLKVTEKNNEIRMELLEHFKELNDFIGNNGSLDSPSVKALYRVSMAVINSSSNLILALEKELKTASELNNTLMVAAAQKVDSLKLTNENQDRDKKEKSAKKQEIISLFAKTFVSQRDELNKRVNDSMKGSNTMKENKKKWEDFTLKNVKYFLKHKSSSSTKNDDLEDFIKQRMKDAEQQSLIKDSKGDAVKAPIGITSRKDKIKTAFKALDMENPYKK